MVKMDTRGRGHLSIPKPGGQAGNRALASTKGCELHQGKMGNSQAPSAVSHYRLKGQDLAPTLQEGDLELPSAGAPAGWPAALRPLRLCSPSPRGHTLLVSSPPLPRQPT